MRPAQILGVLLVTSLPLVAEAQLEPNASFTQATIAGQKFVFDYVTDTFRAGITNTSPGPATYTFILTITRNPCTKLDPTKNWDGTKCTTAPYCTGYCSAYGPEVTVQRTLPAVKIPGTQSTTIELHDIAYGPIKGGVIKVLQEGKKYPVTKPVAGISLP